MTKAETGPKPTVVIPTTSTARTARTTALIVGIIMALLTIVAIVALIVAVFGVVAAKMKAKQRRVFSINNDATESMMINGAYGPHAGTDNSLRNIPMSFNTAYRPHSAQHREDDNPSQDLQQPQQQAQPDIQLTTNGAYVTETVDLSKQTIEGYEPVENTPHAYQPVSPFEDQDYY